MRRGRSATPWVRVVLTDSLASAGGAAGRGAGREPRLDQVNQDLPKNANGRAGRGHLLRLSPSDRFLDVVEGARLMARGYTFVMVDLRGFGGSSGVSTGPARVSRRCRPTLL
jgi:hypothetical protein